MSCIFITKKSKVMKYLCIIIILVSSISNASNKKIFKNSIGMEFILVPSGEFEMGCSAGDLFCQGDEKPRHKVKIHKPFYMGKYEVTQGQWKSMMNENPSRFEGTFCPTKPNCDNHPVENISYEMTKKFIKELNEYEKSYSKVILESIGETGYVSGKYRLPKESEWEYATRGGTNTMFYWGNELIENKANCNGCGSKWDYKSTSPVGSFEPNAFGLYDMLGNVWEWCGNGYHFYLDTYNLSYMNEHKVRRGGSWFYFPIYLRVSDRYGFGPLEGYGDDGFRLVYQLLPEKEFKVDRWKKHTFHFFINRWKVQGKNYKEKVLRIIQANSYMEKRYKKAIQKIYEPYPDVFSLDESQAEAEIFKRVLHDKDVVRNPEYNFEEEFP